MHPASNAAVSNFTTNYTTSTNLNSAISSATIPSGTQFIRANIPMRPSVTKKKK